MDRKPLITGVVLARNEAGQIVPALRSLAGWTDEVLVLDDGSTDGTADLARDEGATVTPVPHTVQFDQLRNAAIPLARGRWLFYLDADERVPEALGATLRSMADDHEAEFDAVAVPRRNFFCGTWIEHCGWFPDYQTRLLKKGRFRWLPRLHLGPQVEGRVATLPPDPEMALVHHSFRDLEHYLGKMNVFTSSEADGLAADGVDHAWQSMLAAFVAELQRYMDQGEAWRDGLHGVVLALSSAAYGFFSRAKLWDLRRGLEEPEGQASAPLPRSASEVLRFMADVAEHGPGQWLARPYEAAGREPQRTRRRGPRTRTRRDLPAVAWTGPLFTASGYGTESRTFIQAMDEAGIRVTAHRVQSRQPDAILASALSTRLRMLEAQPLAEAFVHVMNATPAEFQLSPGAVASVGRTTFEGDRIPPSWAASCNALDQIWVPSEFNVEAFLRSGVEESKLRKVPSGIDSALYDSAVSPIDLPVAAGFVFLSVFDWHPRKGCDVVLRAYLDEFEPDDDVLLVLKVLPGPGVSARGLQAQIESFVQDELGRDPRRGAPIALFTRNVPAAEMPRLYGAADAFVLASRGEGWGFPYLEAMAMGLPAIGTRWGGNLEFMTDENSLLVDAELQEVPERGWRFEPALRGARWAEPSPDQLRRQMRRVVADRGAAEAVGARARADVLGRHDLERVGEAVVHLLEELPTGRARIGRPSVLAPSDSEPVPPVVWTASVFSQAGFSEEARALVLGLDRAGAEVSVNPYHRGDLVPLSPGARDRLKALCSAERPQHAVHVCHVNVQSPNFEPSPDSAWNVARTMYEPFPLPPPWAAKCRRFSEIWVPSDFVVESFSQGGVEPSKLVKIPGCIDTQLYQLSVEPLHLPDTADFTFLSVFGWQGRKGWDVLVRAFLQEFRRSEDVGLVLKVTPVPGVSHRDLLERFVREELGRDPAKGPRIELLERNLSSKEMPALYRSADAFVLPSRGEGWGRPYMEAMAMGLPTIGTRWSGNLDFMTDGNSYLVDCRVTDVPEGGWGEAHAFGLQWAEPSVEHLRQSMRRVVEDRDEAAARGARARRDMLKGFDAAVSANTVIERLKAIGGDGRHRRRPAPRVRVSWEGAQFSTHSYALVNRSMCRELANSGRVDLTLVSDQAAGSSPGGPWPVSRDPDLGRLQSFVDRRLVGSVDVHVRHTWPPRFDPPSDGRWVLIQPWEWGALPRAWLEPLALIDEVWVPSQHVRDAYVRAGVDSSRVVVVPNGVDSRRFHGAATPMELPTEKAFRFLFVGGALRRKGADLLLDAYRSEFTREDDVCLVVKDAQTHSFYRGQGIGGRFLEAASDREGPEILYSAEELPQQEMPSLYTACHYLVAPYRAEGFALPVAEAMACNLPVIVPEYGACLDYCDQSVAVMLPVREVRHPEPRVADLPTLGLPSFCEVDPQDLGRAMRRMVERRNEARAMGLRAGVRIHGQFTWDRAAAVALERLEDLATRQIRRRRPGPVRYPPVETTGASGARGPGSVRRRELSVCLVVRDEEELLPHCLESVRGLAGEIVLVDTGSTDRTVEIAREFGAEVFHAPWTDDFAPVRNEYLRRATGEWILVLDGDNRLDPGSRDEVRRLIQTDELVGFAPRQLNYLKEEGSVTVVEHRDVRLFPRHPELRYTGSVHTQLVAARPDLGFRVVPCDVVIHHYGYLRQRYRPSEALRRYARVIEEEARADPGDPFHAYNLGVVYQRMGRSADAERQLRRAVELCRPLTESGSAPVYLPNAFVLLGVALLSLDRPAEAAQACRRALTLAPDLADAHATLGAALATTGRLEESLAAYGEAFRFGERASLGPTDRGIGRWKALLGMAEVHLIQGRWQDAIDNLERVMVTEPENPAVLLARAQAAIGLGRTEEAALLLRRVASQRASSDRTRARLSHLFAALGRSTTVSPEAPN